MAVTTMEILPSQLPHTAGLDHLHDLFGLDFVFLVFFMAGIFGTFSVFFFSSRMMIVAGSMFYFGRQLRRCCYGFKERMSSFSTGNLNI